MCRSALDTDSLVALIYKGPLEPQPWRSFLAALAERLNCRNAAIVLRLSRQGSPPIIVWGRPNEIDLEQARRAHEAHSELGHLDPLRNLLTGPGAIYSMDEVISREELVQNRFFQEVLCPYGFDRMMGMYIAEPEGWEGNIGVVNGIGSRDFGQAEKDVLLGLRHHLEQSLALFARVSREETELRALIDTLDRQTIATVILREDGSVARMNSAARALHANGIIRIGGGDRPYLADCSANREFQEIIAAARSASRERGMMPFVQAMQIENGGRSHLGVLVRSIEQYSPYVADNGPAIIVYISGVTAQRPMERLVSQLFDLTPSEAHLATLLATGFSLVEAAQKLELTESTVRTYCKSILGKMGVSRQADLVRLVLRSVAVLA